MKLFCTKRSPYARKVRVVAIEKGIKLDLIEQDLLNKSDALLAANPLGKIPALVIGKGQFLVDSPVICQYLDGLKPKPRLIPKDPKNRFDVLKIEAIADGIMDAAVLAFMEKSRHGENFHKEFFANQEKAIVRSFEYLLKQKKILSDFNLGSIAAACAIGYVNLRLGHLNPKENLPQLAKWFDAFSLRPSMQQTIPVVS